MRGNSCGSFFLWREGGGRVSFARNVADSADRDFYCTVCGLAVVSCDDRCAGVALEQHSWACRLARPERR